MKQLSSISTIVTVILLALPVGCDTGAPDRGLTDGGAAAGGLGEDAGGETDGAARWPVEVSGCDAPDPEIAKADAQQLFDYPHVPTFDLYLPPADWEHLKATATEEQYTQAQLCFEGRLVGTVGLRFKGYYGSLYNCFDDQGNMTCPRLSMKIRFDEYEGEQRLYGLKRLNFHAYYYDDSRMKERLAYDLFRSMGIVAPRAAWAVLRVNGESQGLYGMVEQVDGRFTADRWPDTPDGNLYKEVWPTIERADGIVEGLKTNEDVADVSAFVAFSDAFRSADEADLRSVLRQYVDLDYLARYMAVDDALPNYDGISYFWTDGVYTNSHNFYFYEQAPDNFVLIPWDLESTFWIDSDHAAPHWTVIPDDCSTTYPYWEGLALAPACDRVFQALIADLEPWRAACRALLDGPFTEQAMVDAIDRHAAFIEEEVRADHTPTTYSSFDSAVDGLRSVVPELRARLEALMQP
ncbi:MAG: CotH kinase family protein [Polyangiaceae bacterium]|nr:CotH kinase family protein [Polyangiaceae bacterium]